jgi:hypothetical protein
MMTQLANPAPRSRPRRRPRRILGALRPFDRAGRAAQPASAKPTGHATPVPPRPQ